MIYVVQYNLKNGHTCLPRRKVIQTAVTGLDMTEERAEMALDNALEARQLVQEQMDGQPFLFLPHIYEAEQGIGQRIRVMTQYPPRECEIFTSEILPMRALMALSWTRSSAEPLKSLPKRDC